MHVLTALVERHLDAPMRPSRSPVRGIWELPPRRGKTRNPRRERMALTRGAGK
jgi:hypothetical protein